MIASKIQLSSPQELSILWDDEHASIFLSTHCMITVLVQDVKVKQCSSKRTHENHSHHFSVGTISPEFSKWVTMQFRYLGEITIRLASILGAIYEIFASVPAVLKGV
jgi:hypothetical protein